MRYQENVLTMDVKYLLLVFFKDYIFHFIYTREKTYRHNPFCCDVLFIGEFFAILVQDMRIGSLSLILTISLDSTFLVLRAVRIVSCIVMNRYVLPVGKIT